jgi:hypothetical protein
MPAQYMAKIAKEANAKTGPAPDSFVLKVARWCWDIVD